MYQSQFRTYVYEKGVLTVYNGRKGVPPHTKLSQEVILYFDKSYCKGSVECAEPPLPAVCHTQVSNKLYQANACSLKKQKQRKYCMIIIKTWV